MIKKIELDVPKSITEKLSNEKIDTLLKSLALNIKTRMISATPVSSGRAARSYSQPEKIEFRSTNGTFPVERNEVGYSFKNTAPYAHVLEGGSAKGKKPWPRAASRTVEVEGKIYSSQAPSGMVQTGQIEQLIKQLLPGLLEKFMK